MHQRRFQLLGYLQIFIGMGALSGGLPMILSPDGLSSGMNPEILQDTSFNNFLIPGIILVSVNGIGSLIGSYFSLRFKKQAGHLGLLLGFALTVSWLQPLFLLVGIIEFVLGFSVYKKNL